MANPTADLDFDPYPIVPPQPRQKPMEVLCLGLSRTGTMSTYAALKILGLKCYHMTECGRQSANGSIKRWREAVEAKYFEGKGNRLESAEEFDELLWQYEAVSDIPCVLFTDELLKAYPGAKVILTERDVEGWMCSVENSFYTVLSWRIWWWLEIFDRKHCRHYIPLIRWPLVIWTDHNPDDRAKLREGFLAHNARVRALVPKEKLLVFHPRDGWGPLCEFLGREIPGRPFPKVNEGPFVVDLHRNLIVKWRVLTVVMNALKKILPFAIAGLGWLLYKKWNT